MLLAKSIGLIALRAENCLTRPGWPTAARSGGLPPATAVESTVGVLLPADRYLTLTSGNFFLNPSRTSWKFFCSGPDQMPTMERLPLTACLELLAPVAVAVSAVSAVTAAPRASKEMRNLLMWILSGGFVIDPESGLGIEEVQ